MKPRKTAEELAALIRHELAQHHPVPPGFSLRIIHDGESWRVHSDPDPAAPERGELIGHAVEIGDELARQYDLTE